MKPPEPTQDGNSHPEPPPTDVPIAKEQYRRTGARYKAWEQPGRTEPHDYREAGGGLCAACRHGITHDSHAKQYMQVQPPEPTPPATTEPKTSPTSEEAS